MRSSARTDLSFLPGRSRGRGWLRALLRIAAAAAILVVLWCGWLYYRISAFEGIPIAPGSVRADVGIVLGASLWNDKPSPGLQERLDHALKLYRAGCFPRIIVTGGLDAGGAVLTEAEGMRNYLVENGVPANEIYLDKTSRNTVENLRNAKRIMVDHSWHTAIIVTHRYHGARAADIAASLGFAPVQVSVTDTHVMNLAYHKTRETLAFAKWQLNKLGLAFG